MWAVLFNPPPSTYKMRTLALPLVSWHPFSPGFLMLCSLAGERSSIQTIWKAVTSLLDNSWCYGCWWEGRWEPLRTLFILSSLLRVTGPFCTLRMCPFFEWKASVVLQGQQHFAQRI